MVTIYIAIYMDSSHKLAEGHGSSDNFHKDFHQIYMESALSRGLMRDHRLQHTCWFLCYRKQTPQ